MKEVVNALASASDAVIGMALLSAAGVGSGLWLDERMHTQPLFAISLALLGLGLGLARMIRNALKAEKESGSVDVQKLKNIDDDKWNE